MSNKEGSIFTTESTGYREETKVSWGLLGMLCAVLACLLLAGCGFGDAGRQSMGADCWVEVQAPTLSVNNVEIGGVAAVAADDIWVVGEEIGAGDSSKTLTMHWDGKVWSIVPSPNKAEGEKGKNQLYAVAANGKDDVWAVGAYADGPGGFRNMAMHWGGEAWSLMDVPSPGPLDNGLNDVDMVARDDAWAVGTGVWDQGKDPRMTILHWDGVAWKQVAAPVGSSHNLLAVKAISKSDVWAAGTEVLHWDGRAWRTVTTPVGEIAGYLDGISASGPEDVSVTGNDGNDAIVLHWDGKVWYRVALPRLADGPFPHDIEVLGPADIWVAGEYSDNPAHVLPMLVRWNGSGWQAMENPLVGRSGKLQGLAVAGGTLWAAGTQKDSKGTGVLLMSRPVGVCSGGASR